MKLMKLDKTGHSTFHGTEAEAQFKGLLARGYALFQNDVQIRTAPLETPGQPEPEVLALAPLVGG